MHQEAERPEIQPEEPYQGKLPEALESPRDLEDREGHHEKRFLRGGSHQLDPQSHRDWAVALQGDRRVRVGDWVSDQLRVACRHHMGVQNDP